MLLFPFSNTTQTQMFRDAVEVSYLSQKISNLTKRDSHNSLHLSSYSHCLTLPRDTLLALKNRAVTLDPMIEQAHGPRWIWSSTPIRRSMTCCASQSMALRSYRTGDSVTRLRAAPMWAGLELAWMNTHLCNHSVLSLGMKYSFGGTVIWRPIGLCFLSCLAL